MEEQAETGGRVELHCDRVIFRRNTGPSQLNTETAGEMLLWLNSVMWEKKLEPHNSCACFYTCLHFIWDVLSLPPAEYLHNLLHVFILSVCLSKVWPIQVARCSLFRVENTSALQSLCSHQHYNHMWQIILLFHTPGLKTSSWLSSVSSLKFWDRLQKPFGLAGDLFLLLFTELLLDTVCQIWEI